MVLGVLLALLCAQATRLRADLEAGAQHLDLRCRLSGENSAGSVANVGAVKVEPYAAYQHLYILLTEAGVGAGGAGLSAVKAGLDALR